jgi:hypothetical protein
MGPKTKKLILVLEETIDILKKHGESHWTSWLEKDKNRIVQADYSGVEHLLSLFGGIGSFNDLLICKENGHSIEDKQVSSVNDRLKTLTNEIYELAESIRKEANPR